MEPTTGEMPFLDAIKARPNDLVVRLVYADWLEERGDSRHEYLHIDDALHQRIASLSANELVTDPKLRDLRGRLKELGERLNHKWVAMFDALRVKVCRCRSCRKYIKSRDAIDTNPRSHRKMKTTRYCQLCYEDAVRSRVQRGGSFFDSWSENDQSYHGGSRDDI
jgi:uncharacterized protein (TIGR02996 family)